MLQISIISKIFNNKPLTVISLLYIFNLFYLPLRKAPGLGYKPFKSGAWTSKTGGFVALWHAMEEGKIVSSYCHSIDSSAALIITALAIECHNLRGRVSAWSITQSRTCRHCHTSLLLAEGVKEVSNSPAVPTHSSLSSRLQSPELGDRSSSYGRGRF